MRTELYADAIESGLYQPEGIVNENDAEVARKIGKEAELAFSRLMRLPGDLAATST